MDAFAAWLVELDAAALRRGYGPAFSKGTGAECWLPFFEDGYTPDDALSEDEAAD